MSVEPDLRPLLRARASDALRRKALRNRNALGKHAFLLPAAPVVIVAIAYLLVVLGRVATLLAP